MSVYDSINECILEKNYIYIYIHIMSAYDSINEYINDKIYQYLMYMYFLFILQLPFTLTK